MKRNLRIFFVICALTFVSLFIALPDKYQNWQKPQLNFNFLGKTISFNPQLKQGLDIQGGMQVVLQAQMGNIAPEDREQAIQSAREIILRRVDMYGINEPVVQTAKMGEDYRIIVELAGVSDANQALQLVGSTAQLEFKLQNEELASLPEATQSAFLWLQSFEGTGLTGKNLKRSQVQFDQQTNEPVISLEFDDEGTKLFAQVTQANIDRVLAIFIDGFPLTLPKINSAILNGRAQLSGSFTLEEAKNLNIQLNAGALPVSIEVLEQRQIGASLGQASVQKSVQAGLFGIILVMLFMTAYYGFKGLLASVGLVIYAILTVAIYKLLGVVLTLPGIAGLLLSVGMAVDANILIF